MKLLREQSKSLTRQLDKYHINKSHAMYRYEVKTYNVWIRQESVILRRLNENMDQVIIPIQVKIKERTMEKKIGFIGTGNMGSAMIGGIVGAGVIKGENVFIFDPNASKVKELKKDYGVSVSATAKELTKACDWVVVAVKPNIYPLVLSDIKADLDASKVVVSIAAGVTIKQMEDIIGADKNIIRTMPNTPALVGEGITAICPNDIVADKEVEDLMTVFGGFGKAEKVKESLIHAVIGVSGSAPAYVFMFIEAMADAAVQGGMPRGKAYTFAAQTVMGAAKMVTETGMHPGALKDMVCSPGGTTIEAVRNLERTGFRSAVIESMVACMDKSKKMSE